MTSRWQTRAAVTTARREISIRELDVPRTGGDDGILRVEAVGVCGSDVGWFDADDLPPRIQGHETVGVIERAGADARDRWGFAEGDRVVLEEYLPCGHCRYCRSAEFRYCLESDASSGGNALRYGSTPLSVDPGLWGGFSEFQYLHPRTVLHRVPSDLPAELGTLALPIANGYEWAHLRGGIGPGQAVAILGPGQQGLGSVLASALCGAQVVIAVGLPEDDDRLAVARSLGATHTFHHGPDVVDRIMDATGGAGVDVVVNTAAGTADLFNLAVRVVRKGGTIVVPTRRPDAQDGVMLGEISRKAVTVHGVRGHSYGAVETAIGIIDDRRDAVRGMISLVVGLDGVAEAILATGGTSGGARAIHATVRPSLDAAA